MIWKIIDTNKLDEYGDEIMKMYSESYKKIGLIDFGGWNGLKEYLNCSCYLLTDERKINGIILYWLSDYGNKISLVISLNPDIGKKYVIPKLIELLKIPGFYVELSDALEYLVRNGIEIGNKNNRRKIEGIDNIKDKEIIKLLIPSLKNDDIFDEEDERRTIYLLNPTKKILSPAGSYLRHIKDIGIHRKALYGIPCLNKKFNKNSCNRHCINNVKGNNVKGNNVKGK